MVKWSTNSVKNNNKKKHNFIKVSTCCFYGSKDGFLNIRSALSRDVPTNPGRGSLLSDGRSISTGASFSSEALGDNDISLRRTSVEPLSIPRTESVPKETVSGDFVILLGGPDAGRVLCGADAGRVFLSKRLLVGLLGARFLEDPVFLDRSSVLELHLKPK